MEPTLPADGILWDRLYGTIVVQEASGDEGIYVLDVGARTASLVATRVPGIPSSLAPDGSAIAYSGLVFGTDSVWDIRSLPVASAPIECGPSSRCGDPLYAGFGWQFGLVWSPSGREAYIADKPTLDDIFQTRQILVDGAPAHADTLVAGPFTHLAWTSDGHLYAALSPFDPDTRVEGEPQLVRINPEAGTSEAIPGPLGPYGQAFVSPDGSTVAYGSPSGDRVLVAPMGGGPSVDLGPGETPIVWAPDSRSILFPLRSSNPDGPLEFSTVLADVEGGNRVEVVPGAGPVDWR